MRLSPGCPAQGRLTRALTQEKRELLAQDRLDLLPQLIGRYWLLEEAYGKL
jgi:hypothetical protein